MSAVRRARQPLATWFLVIACLPVAARGAPIDSLPTTIHLSRVEFAGLARHTADQVMAAAGMRRGQTITDVELKDLSNRLLRTGLFKKVSNRYLIKGQDIDITFTVEEADWNVPVRLDNFVWFSDAELTAAVAKRLPTFDGMAPETGGVLSRIADALQALLAERKLPGRVTTRVSFDPSGRGMEHVFRVEGVELPICRFLFPGSESDRQTDLIERAKALVGQDYSRTQIDRFAKLTLLPVYQERGRLRARFGEHLARLDAAAGCPTGVSITLTVTEGEVHTWDGARWSGSKEFPVEELDSMLGMKRGEPARSPRIQAGLDAVKEAYRGRGFLSVTIAGTPELTPDELRAVWSITIEAGPRYAMGTLRISGLPENLADRARGRWRLAAGSPFDASYPDLFVKDVLLDPGFLRSGDSVSTSVKAHHDSHLVDVAINVIRGQPGRP